MPQYIEEDSAIRNDVNSSQFLGAQYRINSDHPGNGLSGRFVVNLREIASFRTCIRGLGTAFNFNYSLAPVVNGLGIFGRWASPQVFCVLGNVLDEANGLL
jgi:hypothetical protein